MVFVPLARITVSQMESVVIVELEPRHISASHSLPQDGKVESHVDLSLVVIGPAERLQTQGATTFISHKPPLVVEHIARRVDEI